jgi:endonuclease IV
MFVKSQRQWKAKDYEPEAMERFRDLMKSKDEGGELPVIEKKQVIITDKIGLGYPAESILVHGSYLINLGYVKSSGGFSLGLQPVIQILPNGKHHTNALWMI